MLRFILMLLAHVTKWINALTNVNMWRSKKSKMNNEAQTAAVTVILHLSFRNAVESQHRVEEWSASASDSLEAFLLLINNVNAKTTSRQDPECQPMWQKLLESENYQITQAYCEV